MVFIGLKRGFWQAKIRSPAFRGIRQHLLTSSLMGILDYVNLEKKHFFSKESLRSLDLPD